MRRHIDRTTYDPHQDDIEGLLADPDRHVPAGSTDTVHDLARAAIDAAFNLPQTPGQFNLGNEMFRLRPRDEATREGVEEAEEVLEQERDEVIDAKLGVGIHPHQAAIAGEITGWQSEIARRSGSLPAMRARVAALEAARMAQGANPLETEEEINLRQQIGLNEQRIAALSRNIVKATETREPTPDPFTAAKLRQEQDRLHGHQPSGIEALRHELTSQGKTGLVNPRVWADGLRARKRVKSEEGLTVRQQKKSDRARLARGDTPVHGTGTGRLKDRKDNKESSYNTYNKIARVGNVIRLDDGELLVVQDVQPEVACITAPDGSEQVIIYPDGTPVTMDSLSDILLRSPGSRPALRRVTGADPRTGAPLTENINVDSPALLESIHTGEEWVTLGQLYTREGAEEKLTEGAEDWELAPICIRLDDLVFGIGGDPNRRAVVLNEDDRVDALQNHVVWVRTEQKPGEFAPPVAAEGSIRIFDGHDGHFVVPFTYPEQRRETYLNQVRQGRISAARSARDGESRPPKNGIRDDRKAFFRGPRRR